MKPIVLVLLALVSASQAGSLRLKRESAAQPEPEPEPEVDQESSGSSVHYDFGRHYGYARSPYAVVDPYHVPVVPLRVAPVAYGLGVQGYGYQHKHGYHHDNGIYGSDFGYEREVKHGHNVIAPLPVYSGYVPTYGHTHGLHDHSEGYAIGHDAIGNFDHFTGPFGPFGFYANFYHDK